MNVRNSIVCGVGIAGLLVLSLVTVHVGAQNAPTGRGAQAQPSAPWPVTGTFPQTYRPVTTAVLEKPAADEWVHWRRTSDNWGYSPLDEINRTNVSRLQLAWQTPPQQGLTQSAPLVHDGVMFVPYTPGIVRALDAASGALIWEYRKTFEASPDYSWNARTRTIAIYNDKVYLGTPDAHLVALDARTGRVVWDRTVGDYKQGYRYTSGPIAAGGKIVAGMTGCERYKPELCFITGHDPETGAELWRRHTIAKPGEPGGDSWGDLPLQNRSGGDVWIPGSYDPQTKLMYWSTSNPKPWARVSRKNEGSALYTNSVLAISPDTGALVWYYQLLPGETHDFDEVFENVLIDRGNRASLFKMGKLGILWELDRKTGKYVNGTDLGLQNVMEFNKQTGEVTYNSSMVPRKDTPLDMCPAMGGVRNWQSSAYHPDTQAFYIPIRLNCEKVQFGEVKPENVGPFHFYGNPELNGVKHLGTTRYPGAADRAQLVAMHVSGRVLWRTPVNAGNPPPALTLGRGLVVSADADQNAFFLDAASGEVLSKLRLSGNVGGFPITYAVNGRQYVAFPGNTMHVFALPR